MDEPSTALKPSRFGGWLAQRRLQFALWIAIVEGIIVAVSQHLSWVVALIIAIPFILFYVLAGRTLPSDTQRQLSWIAGASQTFVVLLAILFKIVGLLFVLLVAMLAVVAIMFLLADRGGRRKPS